MSDADAKTVAATLFWSRGTSDRPREASVFELHGKCANKRGPAERRPIPMSVQKAATLTHVNGPDGARTGWYATVQSARTCQ